VFTVSVTADTGAGSLRQAILDANADTTGTNTIGFAIPGSGVHTIQPASDLPASTGPLLIDGTTQTGYTNSPLIELNGSLISSPAIGLSVQGGNSTVKALVINRFVDSCIDLSGKGGDTLLSNYLGTNATGTTGLAGGAGVRITSSNNTVGGTASGAGNLIVGGVSVSNSSGNVVLGNKIGTDLTGTKAMNSNGVQLINGASNNTIGGTAAGAGNLISGNVNDAIDVLGSGNLIQGNRLGTDVTGSRVLAPNRAGISVRGAQASNNTIGGTASGAGNLIAGFTRFAGIDLESCSGTVIQGNKIGTDLTGIQALANKVGVLQMGGDSTTLGGTTAGAGNLISGNSLINAELLSSNNGLIQGNRIGTDATGTTALDPNTLAVNGLDVTGDNCTIGGTATGAGNLISGNSGTGLVLGGTQGSMVLGNLIGTDLTGSNAIPNREGLIITAAGSVTVGGASPGAGNLLSGNRSAGILFERGSDTVIQGNLIGTDATGTRAVGNGLGVVVALSGVSGINTLGGTAANQGNLISGNKGTGLEIDRSAGLLVEGNQIGTDLSGTVALPNTTGILVANSSQDTIGVPGAGNLISGNRGDGITVSGSLSSGVVIQGNRIGTDSSSTQVLGNGNNGITFTGGAHDNLVGGLDPADGNLIVFNAGYGVLVEGGNGNSIQVNSIFYNGIQGIGLINGGNNNQPAPTLTSAVSSANSITVQGTLHAQANTTYSIELYANSDPTDEAAQYFFGYVQVTTDGNGDATINLTVAVGVPAGWAVTATATDPLNNTSVLSVPRVVTT
jgi:titin